jgi:signal transduction histidine kinase
MEHRPTEEIQRIGTRVERLVRAGIRIYAERELGHVLQEVADSAREVIGARYAALGVLDATGAALATFVASGLSAEEHARIGALPHGRGMLGLLIREPRPLRLVDLTKHPQSYGFPSHHPAMHSFLGVPVVGRGGPIGNLYLAEKIGAEEFTQEDEAIAVLLAAQAAGAVENARLNDEALALQHSRDRFYAMINHELRNALTAVFGWADLLLRRMGPEPPRAAREVYESAERTLSLINDLLDLSRLDASKLKPVLRDVDAGEVVREAVASVQPGAQDRKIRVEISGLDGEVPCRTDPQRVRQILINLLTNAVRHSPESETVTVQVRPGDHTLRIDVVDRGEGLTAQQQAQIFEAFSRAGSEDSRGTGLGLTLSRQLARLLGGDLQVESQPRHGARFILQVARRYQA